MVQHFPTALTLYVDVMQSPMSRHICMAAQRGTIISLFIKVAGYILHNWNLIPDEIFYILSSLPCPKCLWCSQIWYQGWSPWSMVGHLSPSIARCNNVWNFITASPYALIAQMLWAMSELQDWVYSRITALCCYKYL